MSENPIQSLLASLRWLQASKEYSDLKIFCDDEVFHVHKAVICSRSTYFEKSCKFGKSEKPKEEITLDDEPRLVKLMIDYFYQLDYDDSPQVREVITPIEVTVNGMNSPESPVGKKVEYFENLGRTEDAEPEAIAEVSLFAEVKPAEEECCWGFGMSKKDKKNKKKKGSFTREYPPEPEVVRHFLDDESKDDPDNTELGINALMYALADKYSIDDLKELARSKFAEAAKRERNWKSSSFPHAAKLVCESTLSKDRGLRTVVIDTLNQHRELLKYEEVQELLGSGNGLALALLQKVLRKDSIREDWSE